ncbi:hypothetical protein BS47DRAFT_1361749 [Hydnum rufescens UP504]|uniref:Uncharacterized protein n=1 Tax=Hydnum rufescens UP504 TaxID=1448309 RepID=A0A9P6AYJ0_9AGAM|nr:hypothetical protein BS47DRAFT_1361749 [Hydnum rufescens UP504]
MTTSNDMPGITHPPQQVCGSISGHHFLHKQIPMDEMNKPTNEQMNNNMHRKPWRRQAGKQGATHLLWRVCGYIRLGCPTPMHKHTPTQINPSTHPPAQYPTPPEAGVGTTRSLNGTPNWGGAIIVKEEQPLAALLGYGGPPGAPWYKHLVRSINARLMISNMMWKSG